LGTAFFVAPGYAVTAAHLVAGLAGHKIRLSEGPATWAAHVIDVRPAEASVGQVYPPPDVALVELDDGPKHRCVLLARGLPRIGARMLARGYTRTFDPEATTAETQSFSFTGMKEATDSEARLIKLGGGEVALGMSGAPVLDLEAGEVAGMMRTSRQLDSDRGGWVVPSLVIRQLWPGAVGRENDWINARDPSWRLLADRLRRSLSDAPPLHAVGETAPDGAVTVVSGDVGVMNIVNNQAAERGGSLAGADG
jgi:S1-C subfamily serine protease